MPTLIWIVVCWLAASASAYAACGDGHVDAGETCDDGNVVPGDGCSALCTIELGWDCLTPGAPCVPHCGDGLVVGTEVCDDGNTVDGDCCNATCTAITDRAPVCDGAAPSTSSLWPPNHKFVPITVEGVTDPDGDRVAIEITAIAQDEPRDDTGDGATCPDASGLGTDTASVRAERSGNGDGRVYHIAFRATDACGLACQGAVEVCVRHDNGHGGTCVDGGPLFDSTDSASGCNTGGCEPSDCVPDPDAIPSCATGVPASVDGHLARARKLLGRAARAHGGASRRLGAKAARQLAKAAHGAAHAAMRGKVSEACATALGAALDDAATCATCGS